MTALMLRYIEGREEVAHQYALALVHRLTADPSVHDALRPARDIVTEVTNDIGIFEEEGAASRIDVAPRQPTDRVEAEPTDRVARSTALRPPEAFQALPVASVRVTRLSGDRRAVRDGVRWGA